MQETEWRRKKRCDVAVMGNIFGGGRQVEIKGVHTINGKKSTASQPEEFEADQVLRMAVVL